MAGSFEDHLIDWELRNISIIFSTIFLLSLLLSVGLISRRNKIALVLTIVTTTLIFFLLMITRNKYGFSFFSIRF